MFRAAVYVRSVTHPRAYGDILAVAFASGSISFNLGSCSISLDHIDRGNLSHALRSLNALENDDPLTLYRHYFTWALQEVCFDESHMDSQPSDHSLR